MRKAIFIFATVALVIGGMVTYYIYGDFEMNKQELVMLIGLVLVISFAILLAVRRIRSIKKNQPPEDELSKVVLKRASSAAFYISLYSWIAVMFLSEKVEMEVSTLIGAGIMLMAVEFALAWVYFNFFGKINE